MFVRLLALGAVASLSLAPNAQADGWGGYYFGIHGTQGTSESDTTRSIGTGTYFADTSVTAIQNASAMTLDNDAFGGGGQLGVNMPLGSALIVGLEIDATGYGNETTKSATVAYPCCVGTGFTTANTIEQSWVGTARLRLGLANDFGMVYATGGFSGGEVTFTQTFSDTFSPIALQTIANSEFLSGYSIGGGIELMIESGVTLRAEYLHMDLGEITATGPIGTGAGGHISTGTAEVSDQFLRLGLSFRID